MPTAYFESRKGPHRAKPRLREESAAFIHISVGALAHKFGFVRREKRRQALPALALAGAALAVLWRTGTLSSGPILCPFRLVTGLPCPACGTTRAVGAMLSGDFESAWSLNPVGLLVVATGATLLALPNAGTRLNAGYQAALARGWKWQLVSGVLAAYAALWVWNASRW